VRPFKDGLGVAREGLLGAGQGCCGLSAGFCPVDVPSLDSVMPALELVELGLLLLELGVGELLDLELVLDLDQELLAYTDQLTVLGIPVRVPALAQAPTSPTIALNRSTAMRNSGVSGKATTDCCRCRAPSRRTSRQTATRARDESEGSW
jgi:hypothetical protein